MVMVKPALAYLDLIAAVKDDTRLPVAAYNVSGEYAMVKAAAAAGYLDERAAVLETLTAIRRAGADTIITYHAKDAARWLRVDDPARQAPRPEAPQPQGRRRGPARRPRPQAAQPDAGQLPARRRGPTRAVAELAGSRGARCMARVAAAARRSGSSARSRRSSTRARSATARCSSPRRSTPRTRSARRR